MRRLHLLVEGQTEETLCRSVFEPHLAARGWRVSISILSTKRLASGAKFRGGVGGWEKVRRELTRLLPNFDRRAPRSTVFTMSSRHWRAQWTTAGSCHI